MSDIVSIIKARIDTTDKTYKANDNISWAIHTDEERDELQAEVEIRVQALLEALIIDTGNDHNTEHTAMRVAKMYIKETFGGRYFPQPDITSFPNVANYDQLYVTGPITIRSTCAHHFQNIKGRCWIGVFPDKEVIGLSKFNRLVHWIVERPQIQEEMTMQIADLIEEKTQASGIAVVIKAEHMCMTHRGVREHESDMTTSIMRGKFRTDPALKSEFLQLLNGMKGFAE